MKSNLGSIRGITMFTVSQTVSDETLNCIITIESAGRPAVKAPTSSATGLGQFIDATWLALVRKHRPDVAQGKSNAAILKMRTDPAFAIEMLARFTEDNQAIVGMNCTGGDLYLAHFLGAGAAQKVYHASPSAAVESLVGAAAVNANSSILRGKTCAQVRAWAAKRMAQSSGHAWVAKYYAPPEDEPETLVDESAEDIPNTQTMPATVEDTPAAAVKQDDAKIITGKAAPEEVTDEHWWDWMVKLAKSKMQWASTGLGGLSFASITGAFHGMDWRVLAALGATVVSLTAVLIVLRGRKP